MRWRWRGGGKRTDTVSYVQYICLRGGAHEFVAAGVIGDDGGEETRAEGAELPDEPEHGDLSGTDAHLFQEHGNQRQHEAVRCSHTSKVIVRPGPGHTSGPSGILL